MHNFLGYMEETYIFNTLNMAKSGGNRRANKEYLG